jgi:hypothetical protein
VFIQTTDGFLGLCTPLGKLRELIINGLDSHPFVYISFI